MSTPLNPTDELVGAFGIPVSTDAEDIREDLHERMAEEQPGWQPIPTAIDTALLGAVATTTAEGRDALQQRLRTELLWLLGSIWGIPRSEGTPAASTITVTAVDTLGHVLPAATTVMLGDVELQTVADLTIPAGASSGTVAVQTVEPGSAANGADDTGTTLEIDGLDWIATTDGVVLDAALDAGTDPWDDVEYSLRIAQYLESFIRAPVLPRQWASIALSHPAVGYAWALRAYNAATDTAGVPFHVTVLVADLEAGALPGPILEEIRADLQARALDNVVVHVISPTEVTVDVTGTVVCRPGYDPADTKAAGETQLRQVLSPAGWATPRLLTDEPHPVPDRVIHVNELIARTDDVGAINWVEDLQIGDGSSDRVTLTVRQLPAPGTITLTAIPAVP